MPRTSLLSAAATLAVLSMLLLTTVATSQAQTELVLYSFAAKPEPLRATAGAAQ